MDQADAVPVSGLALGAPSGGAIGLRSLTSSGRLPGTRGDLLNVIASPPSRRCFRQCRRRTETELALDAFAMRLDRLDAHAQLATAAYPLSTPHDRCLPSTRSCVNSAPLRWTTSSLKARTASS